MTSALQKRKVGLLIAAAAWLLAPVGGGASELVEIELLDKGANVEMTTNMGIGMGGDMSMAPMAMVVKPE